jgi:hypothetical protein
VGRGEFVCLGFEYSDPDWFLSQHLALVVVRDNDNVVGNVVTGNQNLVGNNNQLNVGLYPPRVLPADLKSVSNYLSDLPSKVLILYLQGDGEGYKYADIGLVHLYSQTTQTSTLIH